MLHMDTVKLFQCSQQIKPKDVPILLTAATGVVAHNINRITVHSAFMLNDRKKAGTTYYNLGSDTLSTLNTEQKTMVMYHREWCKETVIVFKQHKPVKPYHVFLSGSGGVGCEGLNPEYSA